MGVLLAVGQLAGCATADPKAQALVAKQAMCSACHGADGGSVSMRAPVLAGQNAAYLIAQLKAFRDQARADAGARTAMWPMAASLNDSMIDSLAHYFSTLPPPAPEPAPASASANIAQGKTLYAERACVACHGDAGQGVAAYPRLAGQHADYLGAQLTAFVDGSRADPVMGPMAKTLAAGDAEKIALYLSTLR